jgi:hypothetical protein
VTLPTVTTDASGNWTVTGLGPGPYRVSVDTSTLPFGITVPTADLDGVSSANTTDVTLSGGQDRTDVDFGYTGSASVGDTIFLDFNGNGLPGSDEGIAGVAVTVTWAGPDGVLGTADDVQYTATTNAAGVWSVSQLPAGLFEVRVDLSTVPPGVVNSVDPDGGNDGISTTTLAAGANDLTQDFGFLGTGQIGRVVFRDDDRDDTPDAGEGLSNVTVHVTWAGPDGTFGNGDDHTFTAITDADGVYVVGNLPAGDYRVDIDTATLPSGSENTVDPDGANDSASALTLSTGESDMAQNFGYVIPVAAGPPPAATPPGTLPFTGAGVGRAALAALSMLSAGLFLVVVTRKNGVFAGLFRPSAVPA